MYEASYKYLLRSFEKSLFHVKKHTLGTATFIQQAFSFFDSKV